MPGDDIISDLRSLGLHLNEAKAYKALVTLGQSTARAVADHSGVPRSKVYDVLYSLEDRGLVRRVLGSDPTEFQPYPPKDAIPYLIEKLQHSGSVVQTALENIEQERNTESRELVYTVEGQDQIKMEMRGIIGEAQREVFIATLNPAVLSAVRPALAEAKKRGLNIQLFTAGAKMEEWKEFTHYVEITNVEGIGPAGLIEQMSTVIEDVAIVDAGWNPTQMGIIIADNSESIGMFGTHSAQLKPWALVVRVPLIAILQRQVITAVLSQVQKFIAAMETSS
ncbi:MAG: helix-turn-helix domain-containing protein [Candidatus Thorarchaeota archaeon]|nr:MAG: helix-turn-helix domain-containing protein [Candidatus Thorarchaeota archaeon]